MGFARPDYILIPYHRWISEIPSYREVHYYSRARAAKRRARKPSVRLCLKMYFPFLSTPSVICEEPRYRPRIFNPCASITARHTRDGNNTERGRMYPVTRKHKPAFVSRVSFVPPRSQSRERPGRWTFCWIYTCLIIAAGNDH